MFSKITLKIQRLSAFTHQVQIQPSWIVRQSYFRMDGYSPPVSNGIADILGHKIHGC
jgi:hypothetical protein